MYMQKVLEACNDALRDKEIMLDVYKTENADLRAKVEEMRALIAELKGDAEK